MYIQHRQRHEFWITCKICLLSYKKSNLLVHTIVKKVHAASIEISAGKRDLKQHSQNSKRQDLRILPISPIFPTCVTLRSHNLCSFTLIPTSSKIYKNKISDVLYGALNIVFYWKVEQIYINKITKTKRLWLCLIRQNIFQWPKGFILTVLYVKWLWERNPMQCKKQTNRITNTHAHKVKISSMHHTLAENLKRDSILINNCTFIGRIFHQEDTTWSQGNKGTSEKECVYCWLGTSDRLFAAPGLHFSGLLSVTFEQQGKKKKYQVSPFRKTTQALLLSGPRRKLLVSFST